MLKLGWFSTGRGEGSRGFLDLIQGRIDSGSLNARIEYVFSNRERGEAEGSDQYFDLVERYGLPLLTLSSSRYRRDHGGGPMRRHRDGFHASVMDLVSEFHPDLCVLAGYMLITSPEMCRSLPMINLHPALPGGPAGAWQEVIRKLIAQKAVTTGVMVHVATEVVDTGPVLAYCTFPIRGKAFDPLWLKADELPEAQLSAEGEEQSLFKQIRQEGMRRERPLLLETLKAVADGRLKVSEGRVYDAHGAPTAGVCLDEEVDRLLEGLKG